MKSHFLKLTIHTIQAAFAVCFFIFSLAQTANCQNPQDNIALETQIQTPSYSTNAPALYRTNPSVVRRSDPRIAPPQQNFSFEATPAEKFVPKQNPEIKKTPPVDPREFVKKQKDKTKLIIFIAVLMGAGCIFMLLNHSDLVYRRTMHHATTRWLEKHFPSSQPEPEPILTPAPAPEPQAIPRSPFPNLAAAKTCPIEQLTKLKAMLDQNLISHEDYEKKKKDILSKV